MVMPVDNHIFGIYLGYYEKEAVDLFLKLISPGMRVVDVGANIGYYTLLAAYRVGSKGQVYVFEPHPQNYKFLLENIALNGYSNIKPVPKAVTNYIGHAKLYLASSATHNLFGGSENFITVETTTLDAFFRDEGWPPIHLVKIDVEGAEIMVMEGMEELSQRNPDMKIIIEFNPSSLERAGQSPEVFFLSLKKLGFTYTWAIEKSLRTIRSAEDALAILGKRISYEIVASRSAELL